MNDEHECYNYNWDGFNRTNCPVYPGFNASYAVNWNCRSIYQSMINLLDVIVILVGFVGFRFLSNL